MNGVAGEGMEIGESNLVGGGDDLLIGDGLSCIVEGCQDVFSLQVGILSQYLIYAHSCDEQLKDKLHRDTSALDDGFPTQDVGIVGYPF